MVDGNCFCPHNQVIPNMPNECACPIKGQIVNYIGNCVCPDDQIDVDNACIHKSKKVISFLFSNLNPKWASYSCKVRIRIGVFHLTLDTTCTLKSLL